jgi:hypothetical protein
MMTPAAAPSYKGFRFPAEIINYAVWLYHRFSLMRWLSPVSAPEAT